MPEDVPNRKDHAQRGIGQVLHRIGADGQGTGRLLALDHQLEGDGMIVRSTPVHVPASPDCAADDTAVTSMSTQTIVCCLFLMPALYMVITAMSTPPLDRELKKGSAELLILSLVEVRPRHGYEISKLIETRSGGRLKFHIASLYPLLYRLEERGWILGTWVEKPGERRKRFYKLTAEGRRVLAAQRATWKLFVESIARITGAEHA